MKKVRHRLAPARLTVLDAAMLAALFDGERDPDLLADLARGRMRPEAAEPDRGRRLKLPCSCVRRSSVESSRITLC